jgi:hypothetical protein
MTGSGGHNGQSIMQAVIRTDRAMNLQNAKLVAAAVVTRECVHG